MELHINYTVRSNTKETPTQILSLWRYDSQLELPMLHYPRRVHIVTATITL